MFSPFVTSVSVDLYRFVFPVVAPRSGRDLAYSRYKINTASKDAWIQMQSRVILEMRKWRERGVGRLVETLQLASNSSMSGPMATLFPPHLPSQTSIESPGGSHQHARARSVGPRRAWEGAFCSHTIPVLFSIEPCFEWWRSAPQLQRRKR